MKEYWVEMAVTEVVNADIAAQGVDRTLRWADVPIQCMLLWQSAPVLLPIHVGEQAF